MIGFKAITWTSDRHLLFDSESSKKLTFVHETPYIGQFTRSDHNQVHYVSTQTDHVFGTGDFNPLECMFLCKTGID